MEKPNFEFHLRKTTTARRPDLIFEDKEEKRIWICDMACPQQHNLETKRAEKLTKYRQLAFEMRERGPGYVVTVIPIVVEALGGGLKKTIGETDYETRGNYENCIRDAENNLDGQ